MARVALPCPTTTHHVSNGTINFIWCFYGHRANVLLGKCRTTACAKTRKFVFNKMRVCVRVAHIDIERHILYRAWACCTYAWETVEKKCEKQMGSNSKQIGSVHIMPLTDTISPSERRMHANDLSCTCNVYGVELGRMTMDGRYVGAVRQRNDRDVFDGRFSILTSTLLHNKSSIYTFRNVFGRRQRRRFKCHWPHRSIRWWLMPSLTHTELCKHNSPERFASNMLETNWNLYCVRSAFDWAYSPARSPSRPKLQFRNAKLEMFEWKTHVSSDITNSNTRMREMGGLAMRIYSRR